MADAVIPIGRMLAVSAKVQCSAVFVSGRDPEEAFANSAPSALHALQLPEVLRAAMDWTLDRAARRVDMRLGLSTDVAARLVEAYRAAFPEFEADWAREIRRLADLGEVVRSARHIGDQGCVIVPENDEPDLRFDPVALQRGPAASAGWLPVSMLGPAPDENAFARVGRVIDGALSEGDAWHAAILVAHHGHLVGEGYGKGIDADMPLESWSMGKSVMSTLIGLLVGRGALDLDAPAPVAAWQTDGDPRRRITLRHLLTMSSGLRCTGYQEPRANWSDNMPEHFHPYTEAIDVARFATERPAEVTAGKIGRYRNCDPLTLATIFDERVRALGGIPQSFPQTELFTPLGMHGLTHETDRWGRFIISGFNYGTARDWARLGHLYLHDGVWDGKRILPEGWVDFVRDPAPAWEEGNYGGQFWLNTDGEYPLPRDTFYMAGGGGQFVFVVPSHDLVIVRQGHSRGWAESKPNVKALLAKLLEAIGLTPA